MNAFEKRLAKAKRSGRPYEACPQFEGCSVNICPLDPDQGLRDQLPEDEQCSLSKPYRKKIAIQFPELLPARGLWPRELAALQAWERRPARDRAKMQEVGRQKLSEWRQNRRKVSGQADSATENSGKGPDSPPGAQSGKPGTTDQKPDDPKKGG